MVWALPKVSERSIRETRGSTAFQIEVDTSPSYPRTRAIPTNGDTARLTWEAMETHPYPPTEFGIRDDRATRHVGAFLIYDPDRDRASVSGKSRRMTNPDNSSQKLAAGFGRGHAHELSHALFMLTDEYLKDNYSVAEDSPMHNVYPSNQCEELPWKHLLAGEGLHDTELLVGAFGADAHGYHSELLCLMNGTHNNADHYGGGGRLRVEDRLCNWCRELATFRLFRRLIMGGTEEEADWELWTSEYRDPFYEHYGVSIPDLVPQSNDVKKPERGTQIYDACVP